MQSENEKVIHKLHTGKTFSKLYAAHRQTYPQRVFRAIFDYHEDSKTNGRQLAVDICCGTGQSAIPLTKYFSQVVGIDISEEQLSHLPKHITNLTGYVAPAEDLSILDDEVADMVTIGSSIHWVDCKRFFKEVRRILKPGGTFAAMGYFFECVQNPSVHEYIAQIRFETLREYTLMDRMKIIEEKYKSIDFPFSDVERLEGMEKQVEMSLEQFLNYIRTYHYINFYYQENPNGDIMEQIEKRLITILGGDDKNVNDIKITVKWNFFIVMGRK